MWVKKQVEDELHKRTQAAVTSAMDAGDLPAVDSGSLHFQIEVPGNPDHGDFSTNAALAGASLFRRSPRDIASAIASHMDTSELIDHVDIAGPGFVNFFLDTTWLQRSLAAVLEQGDHYGQSTVGNGERVLVEFVSANPTGPLNIVNARAAAVGDSLSTMLNWAGFEADREYYINDAGNQYRQLGIAMKVRLQQQLGQDVELPEGAYPGEYIVDLAQAFLEADKRGEAVLELPEDDQLDALGSFAVERIVAGVKQVLADYGVTFDTWISERQDIRDENGPEQVVQELQKRGLTYEEGGAVWFKSTDFGDDKDRVLVKSDGGFTYLVPDIAYHLYKSRRGYDRLVDILGADHHGYIGRMTAALKALEAGAQLQVLIVQLVRLIRGGEVVRMSKRKGQFIPMTELLEEVGRDAARFFFLMRSPDTPMDFDLDLAKLATSENPVYYVQYAHARICSMMRQAEAKGLEPGSSASADMMAQLGTRYEQDLIRKLADFPAVIARCAQALEPHHLTNYAAELATVFHSFYTECRVLVDDEELAHARLTLVEATRTVLANALGILGVDAPEQM